MRRSEKNANRSHEQETEPETDGFRTGRGHRNLIDFDCSFPIHKSRRFCQVSGVSTDSLRKIIEKQYARMLSPQLHKEWPMDNKSERGLKQKLAIATEILTWELSDMWGHVSAKAADGERFFIQHLGRR